MAFTHRVLRIRELMDEKLKNGKLGVKDMIELQADTMDI